MLAQCGTSARVVRRMCIVIRAGRRVGFSETFCWISENLVGVARTGRTLDCLLTWLRGKTCRVWGLLRKHNHVTRIDLVQRRWGAGPGRDLQRTGQCDKCSGMDGLGGRAACLCETPYCFNFRGRRNNSQRRLLDWLTAARRLTERANEIQFRLKERHEESNDTEKI